MNGDLISREAAVQMLREKARGHYPSSFVVTANDLKIVRTAITECANEILQMDAVDAVEIVRCKDCAYRGNELKCPMCFSEYFDSFETDYGMDCAVTDKTTDDGFCHKGAKMNKEGEANEQGTHP